MHRVLLACAAIVTLSGTAMGNDPRDGPLTDGASDGPAAISESGVLMHPSLDVEALLAAAAVRDLRPTARPPPGCLHSTQIRSRCRPTTSSRR